MTRFYWIEDGDVRLPFSPLDPADREGSTPDVVTDVMRQVGFDLDEDSDNADYFVAVALALAEHLTGVRPHCRVAAAGHVPVRHRADSPGLESWAAEPGDEQLIGIPGCSQLALGG